MIQTAEYGHFTFGPAVDHDFVPAPPSFLFEKGHFWSNMSILVGDESNEGLVFTSPIVLSNAQFRKYIKDEFPVMQDEQLDKVIEMYPINDDFSGKQKVQRAADAVGEFAVVCNTQILLQHYPGSYQYKFGISTGIHGQDGFYTVSLTSVPSCKLFSHFGRSYAYEYH